MPGALAKRLPRRVIRRMVLTMSEFGRAVAENGNRGTDHGQGNAMLLVIRRRFLQLGVRDDVMLNPQHRALLLEPRLDFGF